ncbi:solute carrier family 46 member 3-like isoform X2 [Octopus sinensis]|uniref:Proton-coupled folate transporter n=1 Tax=Octopus sinensis TaxID=2607531 RepID=A0A6P7SY25_9MOLL|nr:solute carrier family 46 member 3-like isoform X2 [Octopus sinensis]
MATEENGAASKKQLQRSESLVENVSWRHYMYFVVHVLQSCASAIGYPVMTQFLYAKISKEYLEESNITVHSSDDDNLRLGHCFVNKSLPGYAIQQQVQAINAQWLQYFSLCYGIPSIITVLIAGSWTDVLGRKAVFLLNAFGHMIKYVIYGIVMKFHLRTEYLILGYMTEGFSGSYFLSILVTYAYTADITPKNEKRSFFLVASDSIFHVCFGLANMSAGYFIRATGFFWPLVFATSLSIFSSIIFIFIVPETVKKGSFSDLSPKKSILRTLKFYTGSKNKPKPNKLKFWLCLLAFAALSQSVIGQFDIDTLYVLNSPFCWDSVKIGNYGAVSSFVIPVITVIFMRLMQCCLPEALIASSSLLFFIGRSLVKAFSTEDWQIYLAGLVGAPGLLSFAMIRTIVSQLSDATEQGSVFAGLGTVEAICGMTSSLMLNSIYAHTLLWMKGFVFVVVAICCIAPASLLLALHFVIKKEQKEQGEVTVNTVEMECKDSTPSTSQSNNEDGMKHGKVEEERKESEYDKTTKGEYNLGYTN